MLKTSGLHFSYKNGPSMNFPDLNCGDGEHWLIIGQSGCGKTTLLHLLGGLLRPGSGSVEIDTTDIAKLNGANLDHFRGQHIGIVFQRPHFVRSLNVEQNLTLAQYLAGEKQDGDKVKSLLDKLNLGHQVISRVDQLSQGEQQRVAIARALINDPKVILADEPTSALDDQNCDEVIDLLEKHAELQGATLIIVTHDQRLKDKFENQVVLEPISASV
ncbi:MAG: ATP-binding cassette domain-containing protein [Bacteroidota bacterium]